MYANNRGKVKRNRFAGNNANQSPTPTSHIVAYIVLGIAVFVFNVLALEYALAITFDQ